ncbi:MAG TPA: MFS transporter [Anaerolineales bacterium]|nr:MFS transporter [Anaerolineales bacterium]
MNPFRNLVFRLTEGLPRPFWFLWAGTIVNRLGGFVLPFLTLYLTTERGLSVAQAALMVSLFGAGSFTAALLGGELTDRLGRRPVVLASLFIAPVVTVALGLMRPVVWIAIGTALLGFFVDLYRPAVNAAVSDLVPPENRPRAYGYVYWAINLGAAAAPVIAGLLAARAYLLLFVGDALTTFVFGLILMAGLPETRPAQAAHASHESISTRLAILRREPLLLAFAGLALLFGTIYMQGHVTLPVEMQSHGLTTSDYGLAIAVNGALIVLLGLPASHSAARWPRFPALALAAALLGLGFGLNAFATTLPAYALAVGIWTLGEIGGATVAPSVIADLAPVAYRGLYQGIFGAAWGLSLFTGPVVGGWVYDRFGPDALWGACLIVGLLLAVGYLAMARPARRRMQVVGSGERSAVRAPPHD